MVRPGVLAIEAALLADLAAWREMEGWRRPLVVVVASRQQRDHVMALAAKQFGAVLGLKVVTLFHFCREILAAAGGAPVRTGPFHRLLARRFAAAKKALAELAQFEEGFGLVSAAVEDLLDAAYESGNREALLEAANGHAGLAEILEVTEEVAAACLGYGLQRPTGLQTLARQCLEAQPGLLDAYSGVWFHGFADATQVGTDFMAVVLRHPAGRMYLSEAPDPHQPAVTERGIRFSQVFRDAFPAPRRESGPPAQPEIALFKARNLPAEAWETVCRVAELLAQGVTPEDVAIVCRTMAMDAEEIAQALEDQGVPYSGGLTLPGHHPHHRLAQALAVALAKGEAAPLDLWLELVRHQEDHHALSLACRASGVNTLGGLAALVKTEPRDIPLPLCKDGTGEAVIYPGISLQAAARQAARFLAGLPDKQAAGTAFFHLRQLNHLTTKVLAWPEDHLPGLWDELAQLGAAGELEFSFDEVLWWLGQSLPRLGRPALGGQSGVRLLDLTQARGLSFGHLFVMGVNRGVFPRKGHEDPLLPDALRGRLRQVLRGLPLKAEVAAEERYLFAELLSAAPKVTLSWRLLNEEDKPAEPSGLLGHWLREDLPEAPASPLLRLARPGRLSGLHATALAAALAESDPGVLGAWLPLICEAPVAEGRQRVIQTLEHFSFGADGYPLSPYAGLTGSPFPPGGVVHLPVTRLERWSECPWKAFVENFLGVRPAPGVDAIPRIAGNLVGNLVHQTMERLLRTGARKTLAELAQAPQPTSCPAPREEDILPALRVETQKLARREGFAGTLLEELLEADALPLIQHLVTLEWPEPDSRLPVLSVETEGEAAITAPERRWVITFRADRVDLGKDGGMVLTDYKTGKHPSGNVKAATARTQLIKALLNGVRLQAGVYALSLPGAAGRYLYLDPRVEPGAASLVLRHHDPELTTLKERTLPHLLTFMDHGVFTPRLSSGAVKAPNCAGCQVAKACLRQESRQAGAVEFILEEEASFGAEAMLIRRALNPATWEEEESR